jgi:hypothetical protein
MEALTVIFASALRMNPPLVSGANTRSLRRLDPLMTNSEPPQESHEFSLVFGGPLYRMLKRARLSGSALELCIRRMLVISLVAWFPLFVLTAIERHLLGGQNLPFLFDIESHVRFLVALPLLIFAELIVHGRLAPVVSRFVERGVITPEDQAKFNAAVAAVARARNSRWLELAVLIFTLTGGLWVWRHEVALGAVTWYALPDRTGLHLTLAGDWFCLVSIPLFQFILFRWYLRFAIWFQFLWRVSRLNLRLLPAHPDRAGGIGFLGGSSYAFAPVLVAQGVVLAGLIASRIFFGGQSLMSFKVSIVGLVGLAVFVILGPLMVFTPHLTRCKRRGLSQYGLLASVYVADFEEKWIGGNVEREEILGTADVQALADLGTCYSIVRDMRPVPFTLNDVIQLAVTTILPVLPLLLTVMPLEALVDRVLKILVP